jgi:hypothetical protein
MLAERIFRCDSQTGQDGLQLMQDADAGRKQSLFLGMSAFCSKRICEQPGMPDCRLLLFRRLAARLILAA